MSVFWMYLLIFFIVSGFFVTIFFALKKGANLPKNKFFLLLFLFIYNVILILYSLTQQENQSQILIVYALFVTLILKSLLIYLYIRHPNRFYEQASPVFAITSGNNKYEKTGLSETFSQELKEKLESIMSNQKLYLNHGLKLGDLADVLDISKHHTSQVINEHFKQSFYQFVNAYRIEEAKHLLCTHAENPSICISDIAYQCGFNNRVSFYKSFKKVTNITPKEFIRLQQVSVN